MKRLRPVISFASRLMRKVTLPAKKYVLYQWDFANLTAGDGVTDDTVAFQRAINSAASSGSIVFVEFGKYVFTDTINLPSGTRIVGEGWPELVASGANFQNAAQPNPLIRVGESGSKGSVELQDLIFTSTGPVPGLTILEWNIEAESPGAAAIWGECQYNHSKLHSLTKSRLSCSASKCANYRRIAGVFTNLCHDIYHWKCVVIRRECMACHFRPVQWQQ